MTVTGAPFTAQWVTTTEKPDGIKTETVQLARASDGRVYRAFMTDGKIRQVEIVDVLNERDIWYLTDKQSCTASPPPGRPYWVMRTVAEEKSILEMWDKRYADHFKRPSASGTKIMSSLGTKLLEGMTIFGSSYVFTRNDGSTYDGELWEADRGFPIAQTANWPSRREVDRSKLEQLQFVEPDPKLFIPPAGCVASEQPH